MAASVPPPARQRTIDDEIRSRISNEVKRLHQVEEDVRKEIENALEKENLDRERDFPRATQEGNGGSSGSVHSSVLLEDIEEVRRKVEGYQTRRDATGESATGTSVDSLISCYRERHSRPLDCWIEVSNFKTAVQAAEWDYIRSLSVHPATPDAKSP